MIAGSRRSRSTRNQTTDRPTTLARSRSRRSPTVSRERGWPPKNSGSGTASPSETGEDPGGRLVCPISGVRQISSTPLEARTTLHADATPFLAPYPPNRVRRPVVLQLAEESYPLEELPAESWLSIAFRAFARLAAGRSVHD